MSRTDERPDDPAFDDPALDETAFDDMVSAIDYPMYVVTTAAEGERAGCLVGFATQASIHPPRFLVGISRANHTFGVAAKADHLAVHLISREHLALAERFGSTTGDEVDKFAGCRWFEGPDGLPILTDSDIWFAGRILERFDIGDHVGHLLEPVGGEVRTGNVDRYAWVSFADTRHLDPGHTA